MRKFQFLLFVLRRSYICYYLNCMTVPLIAKLHVCGFSKKSLKLITSYLTNRWQRTKLNTSLGKWIEMQEYHRDLHFDHFRLISILTNYFS